MPSGFPRRVLGGEVRPHRGKGIAQITEQIGGDLADRLRLLTDDHVKAIFGAARVNLMTKDDDDPKGSTLEGWVAAFKDKARQISERSCAP